MNILLYYTFEVCPAGLWYALVVVSVWTITGGALSIISWIFSKALSSISCVSAATWRWRGFIF